MWQLLKPHLDTVIGQFVFPCMCLTEEEIEQFDDDPVEYSRAHFGGETSSNIVECTHADASRLQTSLKTGLHRLLPLPSRSCKSWSDPASRPQ